MRRRAPPATNPMSVFKSAPNPNAARLPVSRIMSGEGQQALYAKYFKV